MLNLEDELENKYIFCGTIDIDKIRKELSPLFERYRFPLEGRLVKSKEFIRAYDFYISSDKKVPALITYIFERLCNASSLGVIVETIVLTANKRPMQIRMVKRNKSYRHYLIYVSRN